MSVKHLIDSLGYTKPRVYSLKLSDMRMLRIHSYSKWALEEFEEYAYYNRQKPLMDIVEDFRLKMDEYCCQSKTEEARQMFAVAYDVANDLLDHLISSGDSK